MPNDTGTNAKKGKTRKQSEVAKFQKQKPTPNNLKNDVVRLAKDVKSIRKQLAAEVEEKVIDTSFAGQAVTSTGTVFLLSGASIGTDATQHVGSDINVHSLYANYSCFFGQTGANSTMDEVRVITFWNVEPNGSMPNVTDLLETASTYSPINNDKKMQFKIISDNRYNLNTIQGNSSLEDKIFRKLKNKVTTYIGDTNGIASAGDNHIFLLLIQSNAVNTGTFSGYFRLRFRDG